MQTIGVPDLLAVLYQQFGRREDAARERGIAATMQAELQATRPGTREPRRRGLWNEWSRLTQTIVSVRRTPWFSNRRESV
jgi:hypothetical protein